MALRERIHRATFVQWLRQYKALLEANRIFAAESILNYATSITNEMAYFQMKFS